MKTGDVLSYSWGYDQTNVEFFEVVRATPKSAWLRPIAGSMPEGETGFMSGHSVPAQPVRPASHCSVTLKGPKKICQSSFNGGREFVSMPHGIAQVWDGKPCYTSWYA